MPEKEDLDTPRREDQDDRRKRFYEDIETKDQGRDDDARFNRDPRDRRERDP